VSRRIPGGRRVLIRVWTASLCGAAALLLALAWLGAGDPQLAGRARALQDGDLLLEAMDARADRWLRKLREGTSGPAMLFEIRVVGARVVEPAPAPRPVPLTDGALEGMATTPAKQWVRGIANCDGQAATLARLRLERASALGRSEQTAEALQQLDALSEWEDAAFVLDGVPLALAVGYRRSDLLDASGEADAAAEVRMRMLADLLIGRFPLDAEDLRFEAGLLAEPERLDAKQRARLEVLAAATAVDRALAAAGGVPRSGVLDAGGYFAAFDGGAGRVWRRERLAEDLASDWRALLPEDGSFALAATAAGVLAGRYPDKGSDGEVVGTPLAAAGLGDGLQLLLIDASPYARAVARRQGLLLASTAVLAVALVALAFAGRRMMLRQAELERMRAEFLAGVSHELRTPAASLVLLADNLADGRVTDEGRRAEYYAALRRDAQRLQRLVGDVLDVSRRERGTFQVDPSPTAPGPLVADFAEDQRARLRDAGLELELDLADDLPEVLLDAGAVERALGNLLENARKYASAGGLVRVSVRIRGDSLCLEVEDRGPGVPEGWRERVFERYERVPAGERLAAGAGLGLTLVHETVLAHGGRVAVESATPTGARFVLRFPLGTSEDAGVGPEEQR
jgi:signal transduction histidine kinase